MVTFVSTARALRKPAFFYKYPGCLGVIKGKLGPYINQKRRYAEKGDKPKEPAKEEEMNLKMPGFIHPENSKEEGYFTQRAKQQIEEFKRKAELKPLDKPDKKI